MRAGLLLLAACSRRDDCAADPTSEPADGRGGNVLVILLDDVGTDKIAAWGEHPVPAFTPNLDALADAGVRFSRAYGQPVCSPTRAALLTGRSAWRTGIGSTVRPGSDDYWLPDGETTLPEMLRASPLGPWSSAAIGKWHLSSLTEEGAWAPLDQGFDRFLGLLENPNHAVWPDGEELGYHHWEKVTDGEQFALVDRYLTTEQTDDALAQMASLPEPWLVYVAYSAAHQPLHVPPGALWAESRLDGTPGQIDAMVEALDTEVGRLLAAVDDGTTVILAGDNGTESTGVRPPARTDRGKDTLHEGGVRVLLSVSGFAVDTPGTVSDALVHLVDVFATVADLTGVDVPAGTIDGTSLLPWLSEPETGGRRCLVIDQFPINGQLDDRLDRSIRDDGHVLIRPDDGPDELYARFADAPWEGDDLRPDPPTAEAAQALRRLRRRLERAP